MFKKISLLTVAALMSACITTTSSIANESSVEAVPVGHDDTPIIPGTEWRVHDGKRPQPKVVSAGGLIGEAPSDAIILFDGSDFSEWRGESREEVDWLIEGEAMTVPQRETYADWNSIMTKRKFGDVQLHIEWRSPKKVISNSQGRGNSGVFFLGKYEVQILDSFNNKTYADGSASSLYGWMPPLVNASRAPGEWQSYDIIFEAPEFDSAGALKEPAYVTVLHNGVLTQHRQRYIGASSWKEVGTYSPHEAKGSLKLQDHSIPVSFRNIWIREL